MYETRLVFEYPDARRARTVARSVAREAGSIQGDRTTATVRRDGSRVVVAVEARDLAALRAGGNTWCSLVETAERAAEAGTAARDRT